MSTISIDRLSKRFGAFDALRGVSLAIPEGCVFGLLGPNGAGKTTTFKCMLGLERPTSGAVAYAGRALAPEMLEKIAYVPERSVLYEWMTVAEHVEMQKRAFAGFSSSQAVTLLSEFGVDPRKRVRALSKGMRTATMVSLAIARSADILIFDEPTSGLDPVNQRHVLNLIINESARGATVIFSSHQIGQVERAAESIGVLDRGNVVLTGNVDELKAGRKIVEGIFPDETFSLNGLASDRRVDRVERNGRIVRLLATSDADAIGDALQRLGASGVRTVDLNLEDIFLFAVSAPPADVAAVEYGA